MKRPGYSFPLVPAPADQPTLVGSVNAAKRHYADAVAILETADKAWLERLITRSVPLSDWPSALVREPDDIKVVVDLQA